MNYVIDPLWIYLIGLVETLKPTLGFLSIVSIILAVVILGTSADEETDIKKSCLKVSKILVISSIILGMAYVFVPSKETVIQMLIAKNVTVDRVQIATDVVQNIYKDILGVISK